MFYNTVIFSFLTACFVTFFSFSYCYPRNRSRKESGIFSELLIASLFGFPSITLGIAIIKFWNQPSFNALYQSHFILIVGGLSTLTPFVIQIIKPHLLSINYNMIDALRFAHVRNPIDVFRIIVPIYAPSITIGICFSFVLILSCLGITLLIIPAGSGSLPISIYNFMHYGSEQAVHTLGIVLTAILFIALTPIYLISKSSGNRYD